MGDLIEFLTARLNDDEAAAQGAADGDGYMTWSLPSTGVVEAAGGDLDGLVVAPRNTAIHIVRWDPARVLAEVAAKRRIIEEHDKISRRYQAALDDRDENDGLVIALAAKATVLDSIVRLLALPYDQHPNYREEWRP